MTLLLSPVAIVKIWRTLKMCNTHWIKIKSLLSVSNKKWSLSHQLNKNRIQRLRSIMTRSHQKNGGCLGSGSLKAKHSKRMPARDQMILNIETKPLWKGMLIISWKLIKKVKRINSFPIRQTTHYSPIKRDQDSWAIRNNNRPKIVLNNMLMKT